ncbi:hypothetical protein CSKR_202697 [Clonorchis sinensis]|uniref:Uncharacterized protein n=1 Tax=Clonorchis sinensis TaxID=79923 RepID=A0A8T1M0Y6_CLOSI|nr:hypothetical protein CSKR_202697 [Clonorchis sinensis]
MLVRLQLAFCFARFSTPKDNWALLAEVKQPSHLSSNPIRTSNELIQRTSVRLAFVMMSDARFSQSNFPCTTCHSLTVDVSHSFNWIMFVALSRSRACNLIGSSV